MRLYFLLVINMVTLLACVQSQSPPPPPLLPPAPQAGDGRSIFRLMDENEIFFQHLDAVNTIRESRNLSKLVLSPVLIAASKTHAFDMAQQDRPWHFGSDGSSPVDRVWRSGYNGELYGENISETYEDNLHTLNAWMADFDARKIILNPNAYALGLGWYQQNNGKIWWVQLLGS